VEATRKTSTTKAALLVIAALSMLLSGLFVATASRSDASPPPACPDGFSLTADAKNCFQAAVITSADNPNTCDAGLITPDGEQCYVAATVIPQEGDTLCPKGFSPDDSLNSQCARFESATQGDPTCPEGARGTAGGCFILVAKGPRGDATCAAGQELVGTNCVETGNPPVAGIGTCPVSADVFEVGNACFSLSRKGTSTALVCTAPYQNLNGNCKVVNTLAADPFPCPAGAAGSEILVEEVTHPTTNVVKVASCIEIPASALLPCPTGTTPDTNPALCRTAVTIPAGALSCPDAGFGVVNNECVRFVAPVVASPQCPVGSLEAADGNCQKPVADAAGAYFCADPAAALNGTSCVFVTGFLIEPAPSLFSCESGTRAVVGEDVICILGATNPNTTSGPSCLQGVLSTDNAFCLVPRIDTAPEAVAVAAPVPSFTG